MSNEKSISSKLIYQGRTVKLRVDKVRLPSGRKTTREIVERSDCVAVIALDGAGNVLLVSQFREAVGKELLEIPAGGIEPGEDPVAAVQRELSEETGYLPRKVEKLGSFYSSPGYCTEYLYLYLATDLIPNRLYAEDTESIKLVRVSAGQIRGLLASDNICDAKSIAGLFTFLEYQRSKT